MKLYPASFKLPAIAITFSACLFAANLSAKDVLLAGLSETGTDWSLFDVTKNILKPNAGELFDDSEMCSFATSANMLAYQQWRNPQSVPAGMPKGNQAIFEDMQKIYGNTTSSPGAILGAYKNNETSCYPEKYYGEKRDYGVEPALSQSFGYKIPYTSAYNSDIEIPGLYIQMPLESILDWAFEHNAPMGLNLQPLYEHGTTPHEITCWGARYSDFDNTITGLFYTDSDDSVNNDQQTGRVGLRITNEFGYENGYWWCELDGNLRYKVFGITLLNPDAFVIPEPSAFGLLAGTLALALAASRRRRK